MLLRIRCRRKGYRVPAEQRSIPFQFHAMILDTSAWFPGSPDAREANHKSRDSSTRRIGIGSLGMGQDGTWPGNSPTPVRFTLAQWRNRHG